MSKPLPIVINAQFDSNMGRFNNSSQDFYKAQ